MKLSPFPFTARGGPDNLVPQVPVPQQIIISSFHVKLCKSHGSSSTLGCWFFPLLLSLMVTNWGPQVAAPMYEADYLGELHPLQILVKDYNMLPSA